jgi:hypothetical protein
MMPKRKRIKRLTKEQKAIAHAPIKSNAGVGWTSPYGSVTDPVEYEEGKYDFDYDPWKEL